MHLHPVPRLIDVLLPVRVQDYRNFLLDRCRQYFAIRHQSQRDHRVEREKDPLAKDCVNVFEQVVSSVVQQHADCR